jgi:iron complex outermembrane receptor protein
MRSALLATSAIVIGLIGAAPAAAQAPAESQPADAQAGESQAADSDPAPAGTEGDPVSVNSEPADGLADIVVTAQRRSENLQRAGLAVDVVTGDALVNSGLSSAGQLSQIIPALSVQQAGGANATFFVRGVGNFTVNGYSDPAIAFNYDGVYVGRPTSTSGVFYDLERVELLKGPQGTLYGRNATAGALNIIPARPRPGEFSGFATASYGNYDAVNVQGAVNVPLGDEGALRFAGNIVSHDGYLSDGTSDEKTQAFRVQMLGRLTPDLTVRLAADWSHSGGMGAGSSYAESFRFNPVAGAFVVTPSGLDPSIGLLDPRAQAYRQTIFAGLPGRTLSALDANVYQDNSFVGANAEIEYRTGAGTLTIIPAARFARLDNRFPTPAFIGFIQEDDSQYSVEARFAGNRIGLFDYILGGFYYDERVKGNYTFSQSALAAYQEFVSDTSSAAVFGRLTANLSDRLRLIGGLRYTKDEKDFAGIADVITIVCTRRVNNVPSCPTAPLLPVTDSLSQLPFAVPAAGGPPLPLGASGAIVTRATTPVDQSLSFDKITYRAAAEYDLGPRSLLYASFETGYRSGGFSLSFGKETFEPEFLDAWTIGSKNRLLGNRLQLNLEAFLWKYKNQQVNHTGIDLRGNQGQFTENVGRSTNKGGEIDVQFLATRNTLLSAQVQYLDATYQSFVYTVPTGTAPPYVGCPAAISPANPALRNVDCSGFPSYQSPKWTLNFGAQQTVPLGAYKLVLQADTQYRSRRVVGFEYDDYQFVDPSWTSNGQISLADAEDRYSIAAFVRNIENERIVSSAPIFNIGGLGTQVTSPPRTYGVRAAMKF